uniref:Uncharacterized protein n=1 Tax=Arundo donax TaxID=35708 RepID=A0A0A9SB24_ARUDO
MRDSNYQALSYSQGTQGCSQTSYYGKGQASGDLLVVLVIAEFSLEGSFQMY